MRKKKWKPPIKKEQPADTMDVQITGTIINDPETFNYGSGKVKQVFELVTTLENKCTCIVWAIHRIKKGDTITAPGRLNMKTNHIVLWSLQIVRRYENEN